MEGGEQDTPGPLSPCYGRRRRLSGTTPSPGVQWRHGCMMQRTVWLLSPRGGGRGAGGRSAACGVALCSRAGPLRQSQVQCRPSQPLLPRFPSGLLRNGELFVADLQTRKQPNWRSRRSCKSAHKNALSIRPKIALFRPVRPGYATSPYHITEQCVCRYDVTWYHNEIAITARAWCRSWQRRALGLRELHSTDRSNNKADTGGTVDPICETAHEVFFLSK